MYPVEPGGGEDQQQKTGERTVDAVIDPDEGGEADDDAG